MMKKWSALVVGLVAAVAVLTAAACGQGSGDPPAAADSEGKSGGMEGVVADLDGTPVAGMRVLIVSGTAPFVEIASETDEKGYYRLASVAPGTFEVAVHDRQGEKIASESVDVGSGETSTLDFTVSTGATAREQPPLPPLPVMRMRNDDRVFEGVQGSYCWPTHYDGEYKVAICADKFPFYGPFEVIPVESGDSVAIEIESGEPPTELSAGIFEPDGGPRVRFIELDPGITASFPLDLPAGVYNVRVFGRWAVGDLSYEFRIEVASASLSETGTEPDPSVSTGFMVPRPSSVEDLVTRADVIVLGTIESVLDEKLIGPYGDDGNPLPAGDDAIPVTDYEVKIESVLKADHAVAKSDALVLRMFGHLSDPDAAGVILNVFELPKPGDHLLFALGRNPDGTYGSGPEGLLDVDGETVTFADGVPFATQLTGDQLLQAISDAVQDPTIFFPRGQMEAETGERVVMEALTFGELVEVEGCLRVNHSNGVTTHLLIWPPDFTLSTEEEEIQILNGAGQVLARVGDQLRISGGAVAVYTGLPSPDQCPGPYWIVGDEVG